MLWLWPNLQPLPKGIHSQFLINTFYSCSISVSVMNLHCLTLTSLTILEKSKTAILCPSEGCQSLKGLHSIQLPFCAEKCYALLFFFFWCSTSLLYDPQRCLKFGVTVCVQGSVICRAAASGYSSDPRWSSGCWVGPGRRQTLPTHRQDHWSHSPQHGDTL